MTSRKLTIDVPELEYAVLEDRAKHDGRVEDLVLAAIRQVYGIPVDDEELTPETAAALKAARRELERGDLVSWDQVKREDGIEI